MKEMMLMAIGIGAFLLVCFNINNIAQKAKEQERERLEAEYVAKVEKHLAEIKTERYKVEPEQKSELEETQERLAEIREKIAEAQKRLEAMEKEEK